MLQFAAFGGLDFDSGLLAIQSVQDTYDQCERYSPVEPAGEKKNGGHPCHDVAKNRQLVWRDRSLAQTRDEKIFDRRVHPCRKIGCAFLD